MQKKMPKTVLTARVEEDIKDRLSNEAAQCGMTLSNYTEHCLRYYNSIFRDFQVSNENNHVLQRKVNALASENMEMLSENQNISKQNEQLLSQKEALFQALKFERERAESLANRVRDLESQNQEQVTQIQDLEGTVEFFTELQEASDSRIDLLDNQILSLKNQVRQLEEEKDLWFNNYEKSCDTRDRLRTALSSRLPFALRPEEIEKAKASLAELKERHKHCTEGELLALSLATVAANEQSSFFMYNLNEFKKKNPYFLTSKLLQS